MPLDRTPDAICYPHGMLAGKLADKLLAAKNTWGPVLKSPRVNVAGDPAGYNFATPLRPADEGKAVPARTFPYGHPLEKQDRYTWFVAYRDGRGGWSLGEMSGGVDERPEEVRFGYLVPDPHSEDPAVQAAIDAALAERAAARHQETVRALADDPALRAKYQAAQGLTAEQMDARYPRLEPRPDAAPGRSDADAAT